jgi:hypothetical protein
MDDLEVRRSVLASISDTKVDGELVEVNLRNDHASSRRSSKDRRKAWKVESRDFLYPKRK